MPESTSTTIPRPRDEQYTSTSTEPIANDALVNESRKSGEATDDDSGERPVREKLKNTTIDALSQSSQPMPSAGVSTVMTAQEENPETPMPGQSSRGRPLRKRSFDDLQHEDTSGATAGSLQKQHSYHKRFRSREINDAARSDEPNDLRLHDDEDIIDPAAPLAIDDPIPRPTTPPPDEAAANEQASSAILSPLKKRTHDELDRDLEPRRGTSNGSEDSYIHVTAEEAPGENDPSNMTSMAKGEPEKKRTRDRLQGNTETNNPAGPHTMTFGFSDTSAISPFGSALPKKDQEIIHPSVELAEKATTDAKGTSPSAFASSGMSAFARSESSPFGSLGSTSKPSGFASSSTNGKSGFGFGSSTTESQSSPFASAGIGGIAGLSSTSTSAFGGSKLSGGFGSGFASAKPLGGGLSSFASPASSSGIIGGSSGPVKAFGAPTKEEEDDDEEGSGDSDPESAADERPKDKKFVEQDVETGEEHEETIFSCKAKLFHFDMEWKERGIGTFKLNLNEAFDFGGEHERKARFIMRTEGVHRVVLNTPVFKDMKVGNNEGKEPTGKMVNLSAIENGKFVPLLLKTGSLDLTRGLYHKVKEIQERLDS